MTIALVLFVGSFLFLVTMLNLKLIELNHGRHFIFSQIRHTADALVHEKRIVFKKTISHINLQNIISLFLPIILLGFKKLGQIRIFLYNRFEKVISFMKGRDIIKSNGRASDFLQNMTDHKENFKSSL
ncbi:MAG: hypothetical protein WCW87_02095 [Candidatus Paceibacterota bacterium]